MNRIPSLSAYQPSSTFPLTLLSWNISNAKPSFSAPNNIHQRAQDAPRLIREECLRYTPDIIALQECPYPQFGTEEFTDDGYISAGTQQSHCGYVDLLIRKELIEQDDNDVKFQPIHLPKMHPIMTNLPIPSVATKIQLPNNTNVAISSSHLSPFKDNANLRLLQIMTLMDSMINNECDNCILLGDMNMRKAEDKDIENAGLIDAWKTCGSKRNTNFTWNSYVNRYHDGGFKFRARFDRCYVYGEDISVREFGLIGNNPVDGTEGDYLSDHFGLKVGLDIS